MTYKKTAVLCLSCFLLAFLLTMLQVRQNSELLAEKIAPSILRFHVLANSDSQEDQQLKLEVRDLFLGYLKKQVNQDATKETISSYILSNRAELEQLVENYMLAKGHPYQAQLELTNSRFPTRVYGDLVLPEGNYDAVRLKLGKANGHNWWCVLYPQLCYINPVTAVVSEDSKKEFQSLLTEEDYHQLENTRPRVKVRFRCLELLENK